MYLSSIGQPGYFTVQVKTPDFSWEKNEIGPHWSPSTWQQSLGHRGQLSILEGAPLALLPPPVTRCLTRFGHLDLGAFYFAIPAYHLPGAEAVCSSIDVRLTCCVVAQGVRCSWKAFPQNNGLPLCVPPCPFPPEEGNSTGLAFVPDQLGSCAVDDLCSLCLIDGTWWCLVGSDRAGKQLQPGASSLVGVTQRWLATVHVRAKYSCNIQKWRQRFLASMRLFLQLNIYVFKRGFSKIICSMLGQTNECIIGTIMSSVHPRVVLSGFLMMR